ncbi:MAG TPA: ATP-binding cassette domain-containing protein [Thermoleophilaceae bacterium]|nr:ATP-binding cassette domain-containing protein [Thermoleophilaceae bacterium]
MANDSVDFEVYRGEIVAIVGDNGAGKSTLVKMIAGAVIPDEGEIRIDGEPASIRSPLDAHAFGIETIYQDLAMAQNLDVITNVYLGRELRRSGPLGVVGVLDRRRMHREATAQLDKLKIDIPDLKTPVELLSGGQRQSVAIARAMVWASRVVIMDEPTAALGASQSAAVLEIVKGVRDQGTSVVIISHILPHVLELADRVVVMRHGRKVGDIAGSEVGEHDLIELIIGTRDAPAQNGGAASPA